ncbi:MAG: hypothetical protein H8E48_15230 [Chloroflexi bacterium]|nr:hypothetical protein [Chloroflexota bacterium]
MDNMPPKEKSDNDRELEVIADLQAEGYNQLTDMVGPLRRRMAKQTERPAQPTPLIVRVSVVLAGLAAIGLLLLAQRTG